MADFTTIREEEKRYHDWFYSQHDLFVKGSWLSSPVKSVIESLSLIQTDKPMVLDLGCGVGRNSIPMALSIRERQGKVDCVDLLETAIEPLRRYSKQYGIEDIINSYCSDIADFSIPSGYYDFVVAVSSLEHVSSLEEFTCLLDRMIKGTRECGIHCLVVNSEVKERDAETGEELPAMMEVNVSEAEMTAILSEKYAYWKPIKVEAKPLQYEIKRRDKAIMMSTNAITYIVQKQQ
ncbi:class I SAM-dependent methyltransferase [Bacillus sp. 1P06AnD]|uniref:class I SAM-dependent methyltransferase n=1 Tax=Bacillus sp. 1P06AnD TaxID=3132208 RepID=UPI00399F79B8